MKFIKNKKKDRGYAILFTVVVVGVISMITIGLSNATYKQIILSSVAKDSTTAFYQADIASECVLYADHEYNMELTDLTCAGQPLIFSSSVSSQVTTYSMNKKNLVPSTSKCFRADVIKEPKSKEEMDTIKTTVEAYGYNICDMSNSRTVERAIEINY